MNMSKMAGWCLILTGAAKVFQAIYLQAVMSHSVSTFHIIVTSLLLTVGAAFFWLGRVPWRTS